MTRQILNRLRTGPYLQILVRGQQLLALRYQPDLLSILSVEREGQRYRASTIKRKFDVTERAHRRDPIIVISKRDE